MPERPDDTDHSRCISLTVGSLAGPSYPRNYPHAAASYLACVELEHES